MALELNNSGSKEMVSNGNTIRSTVHTLHALVASIHTEAWEPIDQPTLHGKATTIVSSIHNASMRLEAYGFEDRPGGGLLEDAGRRFVVLTELTGYEGEEPSASAVQYALGAIHQQEGMPDAGVFYYPIAPGVQIGYEGSEAFPPTNYAAGYLEGYLTHKTRNDINPVTEVADMATRVQFMLNAGQAQHPGEQFCSFDIAKSSDTNPAAPDNVILFRPSRRRPANSPDLPPAS